MKKIFLALVTSAILSTSACANTPQGKLHKASQFQKLTVDGAGNAYLDYCEQVRKPSCVKKNSQAASAGASWGAEERVACLGACDSNTAKKIKPALDVVIAAQLVVYAALKSGSDDAAEIAEARSALIEAAEQLLRILRNTGALDVVQSALLGGK